VLHLQSTRSSPNCAPPVVHEGVAKKPRPLIIKYNSKLEQTDPKNGAKD